MLRDLHRVLLSVMVLAMAPFVRAQELSKDQFRADFNKGLELADEKLVDKAMKRGAYHALNYYEELYWEKLNGTETAGVKCEALLASWKRAFENGETMEKLDRWVQGATNSARDALRKGRDASYKLWTFYTDSVSKELVKGEYLKVMQQFGELARNAEALGHSLEVSELWSFASVVGSKMPEKTIEDRIEVVHAMEQFLSARDAWGFTFDEHYVRAKEFVKAEKVRIEEAQKTGEKRKAEGYDPNAKGVDSLVVPGKQETLPIHYEGLTSWENDLDYGPKGGPVPAFWWMASTAKEGSNRKLDWFRRKDLYMVRLGAAKFGVSLDPSDLKKAVEVDASNKGKPSTFWLDAEKKQPYSMFFWTGTDRERVGEAECNLMPSDTVGNVYFRSAASWKVTIAGEPIVLYDDNASGAPCDADPFEPPFRIPSLGEHDGEGTSVPLLDSMRIGKGPRIPYSEFVHLTSGWFHVRRGGGDELVVRPLNAEYVKTGKVKLVWAGPKPSAPVQLVLQGAGDYKTAFFDVAGGKEVDVPAGNYSVVFGRIVVGKGARAQMANLYRGSSPSFDVEPGKVQELKMGAPFTMQFTRRGDGSTTIDALKILLREASGCLMTDLQGMVLAPEVLAAKSEDGKGAKVVAKFVRFTDGELINKAAEKHNNVGTLVACFPMPEDYRAGELVLKVRLPADGMKIGLSMKKHPLFGPIGSAFQ